MSEASEAEHLPTEESIRLQARSLVLEEARRAFAEHDIERFDHLLDRLTGSPEAGPSAVLTHEIQRESFMDRWRLALAAVLIVGLIVVVGLSVAQDSEFGGDYVPLLSGLAGIAIGWLYSGTTGRLGTGGDA
jgi:1,4-dihydroxy-2-naphthoate octaprenyltransferase